jgi:hypothetical protein
MIGSLISGLSVDKANSVLSANFVMTRYLPENFAVNINLKIEHSIHSPFDKIFYTIKAKISKESASPIKICINKDMVFVNNTEKI